MDEQIGEGLKELAVLYSKTKRFILLAEETDPESRANIAIFKEQRDALDHIMRALIMALVDPPENYSTEYVKAQFDNATGHLFRAAYDSLDGVNVSFRLRLNEAKVGVSNGAISAVYPDYFGKDLPEMLALQEKIADLRAAKDIRKSAISELDDYCAAVDRLIQLTKMFLIRVPAFEEWQKRERISAWLKTLAAPVVVGAAVFFLTKGCQGESNVAKPQGKPSVNATP